MHRMARRRSRVVRRLPDEEVLEEFGPGYAVWIPWYQLFEEGSDQPRAYVAELWLIVDYVGHLISRRMFGGAVVRQAIVERAGGSWSRAFVNGYPWVQTHQAPGDDEGYDGFDDHVLVEVAVKGFPSATHTAFAENTFKPVAICDN